MQRALLWVSVSFALVGGCGDSSGQAADDGGVLADAGGLDSSMNAPDARVDTADGGQSSEPFDCTTTERPFCVNATGLRGAMAFSCRSSSEGVTRSSAGTPSWALDCFDSAVDVTVHLEFPVRPTGPFTLRTEAGQSGSLKFSVSAFNLASGGSVGSMTADDAHLLSGMLSGNVLSDHTMKGTLVAAWGTPINGCKSGNFDDPCTSGMLRLTFHTSAP